jgi:hypothetical protein
MGMTITKLGALPEGGEKDETIETIALAAAAATNILLLSYQEW